MRIQSIRMIPETMYHRRKPPKPIELKVIEEEEKKPEVLRGPKPIPIYWLV